ncbi:MAG: response regulator [Thermoanaerobaculia bacterium]|nr:response regulator [Thermoanaerobaculia bacterium]
MTGTAHRVLLVEDDPDDRVLVRRYLEEGLGEQDLSLETASSLEEARSFLEGDGFDAALVDYRLGPDDGLDLVRWIRESDLDLAAVLLTGKGDEEVAAEAMRDGADDYLAKAGLGPQRLATSVQRSLELARARRERREAREALARSEARYRTIVETANEGVWIVDEEGRTTFANERMAEMLGISRGELVGKSMDEFVDEEYRARTRKNLERRREGIADRYEFPLRRPDGSRLWVLVSATPVYDEDGRYEGSLAMVADLTEHRKLEEQVREAQKLDAVGRLAGGVAHDFNNVLSVIVGYGEMLLDQLPETGTARKQLGRVLEAAGRAERLIQQLLAVGRKQISRPRVTDLSSLLGEMEELIRRHVGEAVDLRISRPDSPAPVLVDRGQMEQVVINLVSNARDAMPGGGKLTLEVQTAHLDEEYRRRRPGVEPGEHVMLAVSDTGQGMDEETRSHAFEPFFTTKDPGKGTGLGLASVHGIVRQSGGHVWLYSEPGRGTTIKIYLPRTEEEEEWGRPEKSATPVRGGTEKILVVEDAEMVRNLVRDSLETFGYRVLTAETPEAAEDLATSDPGIDLLVTDVVMPDLSGPELAGRIREQRPELPVLYMSGYSDEAIVHHGVLPSATEFLPKPFSPGDLARKVREVLADRVQDEEVSS